MMVRDGDVASPSNYVAVPSVLRAVGKRVQVYVAAEDSSQVDPAALADLVSTFDDRVYPLAARSFGLADDTDCDGRFTVMLSSWLDRLSGGRYAVDGFVRVTDLDPRFSAPFGNRCDMMYLSTRLKAGAYLRTVLAHEYMHAVVFSAKSHSPRRGGSVPCEEEGWLDEALAHLAEDLHGFSRSNIDYRISAFLSQPERYQLAVEDYFAADLFRSHGNRGSTYLFLRWCVDCYGPGLIPALVRSPLRGVANLEEATGCSLKELYRRWSVALYLSGMNGASSDGSFDGFQSLNMRSPIDGWQLAGPRASRVSLGEAADRWIAAGTSSHYVLIESPAAEAVDVKIAAPATAEVQVTAVPMPAQVARLRLSVRSAAGPDGEPRLRASVQERGGQSVRLTALAWEPLVPPPDPHRLGPRSGQLDGRALASCFGTCTLKAGGTLDSQPIRLHHVHLESGAVIVKLIGTDERGHRVAAWAELKPPVGAAESEDSTQPADPLD
jgi:hypothetical protein